MPTDINIEIQVRPRAGENTSPQQIAEANMNFASKVAQDWQENCRRMQTRRK